ncbi:hypothetical protein RHSIM_Rhsim03G0038700 [Rhododendron simsii]|uniref:Pectinesterase inhibitor domain-containing protein n=1 Tax=Rhododendron simsii TaxID=118357 RepID=A0A834H926_RHOSS|nr:hypothetical protein RHSIM_Rhsim03G0038700 [Rhododendron simsii]
MSGMSLLFLLILFTLNYHSHADLISSTCEKNEEYIDLCISTLRSDPRSAAADVAGLARIMFDATLAKATATLNQIKDLLKKTSDPVLREYLNVCVEQYDDAIEDIPIAIQNVGSHNFASRIKADDVLDEARSCEEIFTDLPNRKRKSPFTAENDIVKKLVMIAAGISKDCRIFGKKVISFVSPTGFRGLLSQSDDLFAVGPYVLWSFLEHLATLHCKGMKTSLTMSGMSLHFLLILFTLNYHSHADLISSTCEKNEEDIDLCISTLRSDPRSAAADVAGLARIMFDATLAKATATLNQIKDLLKKTSDPVLREYLNVCVEQYDDAIEDIPVAIQNVGSNNFASRIKADDVVDEARSCEEIFTDLPNRKRKSPFTAANDMVKKLVMIAAGIVESLG